MKMYPARVGLMLAAIWTTAAVHAANYEIAEEDLRLCSGQQDAVWRQAVEESFGVTAISDPDGHWLSGGIEKWLEDRYLPIYSPYDLAKETMCGTVARYEPERAWGDETQWNLYVIPGKAFDHVLSIPRQTGTGEIHDCRCSPLIENCKNGTDNCLEAEVAPDFALYANPWFPERGPSPLTGRKACVYGAWVADHGHGRRPEIHPAEIFWWRSTAEEGGGTALLNMLLVQDVSGRFDRPRSGTWRFPPGPDGEQVPWSKVPAKYRLRFAFESGPEMTPERFDIYAPPYSRRHVVTADYPELVADADDGRHHALSIDGTVAVEVEEVGGIQRVLGVTFDEVCKKRDGTGFRGWVQVRAALGEEEDKRGYLALAVARREAGTRARQPSFPEPVQETRIVTNLLEGSLDFAKKPWGAEPHAKLRFAIRQPAGVDASSMQLTGVDLVTQDGQRYPLKVEIGESAQRLHGAISSVPLVSPATVELTIDSGEVLQLNLPGHTIATRLTTSGSYSQTARPRVWQTVRRLARIEEDDLPSPPAELLGAKSLLLTLEAEWVPLRDGEPQPEESSPLAIALARAFVGGGETPALFGSESPMQVTWSYEARNLSTGLFVPFDDDESGNPEAIKIERKEASSRKGEALRFTFPKFSQRSLIEIRVSAEVTDAFGNRATAEKRLWNHALRSGRRHIEPLFETLGELRNAPRLIADSELESDADPFYESIWLRYPTARQARLRLLAIASDGYVEVDEFLDLLRSIDTYRELSSGGRRF